MDEHLLPMRRRKRLRGMQAVGLSKQRSVHHRLCISAPPPHPAQSRPGPPLSPIRVMSSGTVLPPLQTLSPHSMLDCANVDRRQAWGGARHEGGGCHFGSETPAHLRALGGVHPPPSSPSLPLSHTQFRPSQHSGTAYNIETHLLSAVEGMYSFPIKFTTSHRAISFACGACGAILGLTLPVGS